MLCAFCSMERLSVIFRFALPFCILSLKLYLRVCSFTPKKSAISTVVTPRALSFSISSGSMCVLSLPTGMPMRSYGSNCFGLGPVFCAIIAVRGYVPLTSLGVVVRYLYDASQLVPNAQFFCGFGLTSYGSDVILICGINGCRFLRCPSSGAS